MAVHLVLVHGSRLSGSQWAPQVPLLEDAVTLSLVDLPGHGSLAGERFTLERCVEVVDEAVLAAPVGVPIVVAGHSLGGYVAMAYAQARGKQLDGLVLAGCSAVPRGIGAAVYRRVAAFTDWLGPARMTRINNRVLRTVYAAEVIEPVIEPGFWFEPTADAWNEVITHCRPTMLSDLSCPVLLLNGQFDQFRLGVRDYVAACPHAQVETIPRASHLANLDQPQAFADALLRFTDRVTCRDGN